MTSGRNSIQVVVGFIEGLCIQIPTTQSSMRSIDIEIRRVRRTGQKQEKSVEDLASVHTLVTDGNTHISILNVDVLIRNA